MPKYSIMIPAYNGMPYLKSAVETIIQQNYDDYELLLSEDHSTDDTANYIDSITDEHVIKLHCPDPKRSMAEHWEWVLSQAKGEWLMYLGQDDGVLPYFFELADILTEEATKLDLRTIVSERAYYFWPGCEIVYGKIKVSYCAKPIIKKIDLQSSVLDTLVGPNKAYHVLPQMYANSLFKREVIEEARHMQNGRVFITHPQDSNLVAIAANLEDEYLYSGIPLGWVGTSVKSAGLATTVGTSKNPVNNKLKKDYELYNESIKKSELKVSSLIGENVLFSNHICLWNSLLCSKSLGNEKLMKDINSKKVKLAMFSTILYEIKNKKENDFEMRCFNSMIEKNEFDFKTIEKKEKKLERKMRLLKYPRFIIRCWNKVLKIVNAHTGKWFIYVNTTSDNSMTDLNNSIFKVINVNSLIKKDKIIKSNKR